METKRKVATLLGVMLMSIGTLGIAGAQTPPPAGTPTAQPGPTSVPPGAVMLYGTTSSNKLVRFDSGTPGTIAGESQITGLQSGENVLGIDFRPATGQLFALGSTSRLYTLDLTSGAATVVGSVLTTTLQGTEFGFDFNPTVDRIRVVSDQDQDLRLNPNNGTVGAIDGTLAFTTTDRNAGQNPNVVAAAYTNNFPGPASTLLYNIDSNLDVLVTQNPPNAGVLNTVGPLGVDVSAVAGFDIVGSNTAFAALRVGDGPSGLYTINLTTGAATLVGNIGGTEPIRGLAGMLSAAPATLTPAPATATAAPPPPTPTACPGGVVNSFTASSNGAQEVPPVNTQGTGSGTFTYDPAAGTITFNFSYSGLSTEEVAAHLHRGAVGVNGPVIVPLPVGANKSGTIPFPAAEVANLRAGLFYANVHTTQFPAGEIRGQLVGQCPGGTAVASTPTMMATAMATAATTSTVMPPAATATMMPPAPTVVPFPTQELPPATPPGMPRTGGDGGMFFYLLIALTGIALLGVGVMSRRPIKR